MPTRREVLEQRGARLGALTDLDAAVRASIKQLWADGRQPESILIRSPFIARTTRLSGEMSDSRPPAMAERPPLARLITSNGPPCEPP